MGEVLAKLKKGPCWKCGEHTRKHIDLLMVVTPSNSIRIPIYTCNHCWDGLEEGELTNHKKKLRDDIKNAALTTIQDQKVDTVREQQEKLEVLDG